MSENRFCPLCSHWQPLERFEIKTLDIETGMNTIQELKYCFDCRYDVCNAEEYAS